MKGWLTELLFDWVFVIMYRVFQGFLNLVNLMESFFDIFAGTAKVFYKGNPEFLINIFFAHDAVTNAFWAMALIAIVLAFGFCIVQMARKATDVSESVKQSVGQIMSNFFRCLLIIVLINTITVVSINISNVLLDRINYALENAAMLDQTEQEKTFSEQEYATMTKVLATVANYSVNPSANSRYNVNSCFNSIRMDLYSLYVNGFFDYDYPLDTNGHYTWQGALALLASSADLTQDLNLSTYYEDVENAFKTVSKEISTYKDFAPIQTAQLSAVETVDTDVLIFLLCGMQAAENKMYNTGNIYDSLRKGYVTGSKSYNNLEQVRKDFDIWDMDYMVGYISSITFIIIMAICIFTFIVRMFNLLLLYLTAPLFVSSMPLDDGGKWNSWTQAFVIQLFSGFGMVIAMRLYLIIIPVIISSDLVFFAGSGLGNAILNHTAQLLMVLGGAWAVLQAGGLITGILAGNPGMAAINQEGRIGGMVTSWAMRAPRSALGAAKHLTGKAAQAGKYLSKTGERMRANQDKRANLAARKAQQRQNVADNKLAKANKLKASGASDSKVNRATRSAQRSQDRANEAIGYANRVAAVAGRNDPGIKSAYSGGGGSFSSSVRSSSGSSYISDAAGTSQRTPSSSSSSGGSNSHVSGTRDDIGISSTPRVRVPSTSKDDSAISSHSTSAAANIPQGSRAEYWRNSVKTPPPPRNKK